MTDPVNTEISETAKESAWIAKVQAHGNLYDLSFSEAEAELMSKESK